MQKYIEDYGPLLAALVCFICLLFWRNLIAGNLTDTIDIPARWSLASVFTSVFNWSAIQSGFLFGVYGYVAGKTDGFIGDLKQTNTMSGFLNYTKRAIYAGFILTIASIPLTVIEPSLNLQNWKYYTLVTAWFSLFIWAFLSFLRVAYLFGLILKVPDK